MLVLTRKIQEQIQIGENITITILRMKGQTVRVGIDAPEDVRIVRGELRRAMREGSSTDMPDEASSDDCQPALSQRPSRTSSTERVVGQSRNVRESESPAHESLSANARLHSRPRMPRAIQDRRFSSPLLAIATRRMRRRRAHFIPDGQL